MTVEIAGTKAFITGSSRGIGRGIALRLAECGAEEVGVHYHQNEAAAEETLELVRDRGAGGFLVQGGRKGSLLTRGNMQESERNSPVLTDSLIDSAYLDQTKTSCAFSYILKHWNPP